jgi:uncharacterized membrane protein YvbJ
MRCYNCGKELPDNSKVCLSCGKKVGERGPSGKETFSGAAPARQKGIKPKLSSFRIPLIVVSMISLLYILILYLLAR